MNLCLLLPLFRIGKEGKFTVRGNRIQRFDLNMISQIPAFSPMAIRSPNSLFLRMGDTTDA
jgi:hypothetical protein